MTKEQIQTAAEQCVIDEGWLNDGTAEATGIINAFHKGYQLSKGEFTQLIEAAREAERDLQKLVARLEELPETTRDKGLVFSANVTINDLSSALKNIEG